MIKEHHIIFVPGLSGSSPLFNKAVGFWKRFGFIPHSHQMAWKDNQHFKPKLKNLIKEIDELSEKSSLVSIVGTSAGGSMALNAFYERQNSVYKIVNVGGRLRAGKNVHPTLGYASRESISFRESVELCEEIQSKLNPFALKRVLTMHPVFDEVVPISTNTLKGTNNVQIPFVEHILSIGLAMTIFTKPIVEFLRENIE